MPRISQKEIIVNQQIKMQLDGSVGTDVELYIFDPEWGSVCIDPDTGKEARMYDHVPRSMKFSGGAQVWFLIPRYVLDGGGMFRVLPANLCSNKQYAVEVIQETVDDAIETLLDEGKESGNENQRQEPEAYEDVEDRPCERTKWLWKLWFLKNLLQIEAVLRIIRFVTATMSAASEVTFMEILQHADYLGDLRMKQQDDWLKFVIQTAWNSGRPLTPLRDCRTLKDIYAWITIRPISNS